MSSLLLMLWIGVGTQVAKAQGYLKVPRKPVSFDGCPSFNGTNFTFTTTEFTTMDWETTTSMTLYII